MSEGGEMTDKTLPENFKWSQFVQSGKPISEYVDSPFGGVNFSDANNPVFGMFEKIFYEADKRKES